MNNVLETKVKPEIPLVIVGYDFRIASSAMREKLVTSKKDRENLLNAIQKMDPTAGLLVLETCNRMEWIVSTQMPGWVAELLKAQMLSLIQKSGVNGKIPIPKPKLYTGHEAVLHVIRVVFGMESLAVGEAQIAGQFQAALQRSLEEKTSNNILNRLAHVAGRAARFGYEIEFRSNIKQGIHSLVTDYIENYFGSSMKKRTVLVAGMGEIGRKTADLIKDTHKCKVVRLNRTVKPHHRGEWVELKELQNLSKTADALVVATGASAPIITAVELDHKRKDKLLVMDIGIPRQVMESTQSLPYVEYCNIDHLQSSVKNWESVEEKQRFEERIEKEIDQFRQYCRSRDMTSFLSSLHSARRDFIHQKIPEFFSTELADLDQKRRARIEKAMKQLLNEYSSNMFIAFHKTMESFWSRNGNEQE